ncbi:substrate-binding domain-containing protein [Treponema sp.]
MYTYNYWFTVESNKESILKKATLKDIARETGVSARSVSNAINRTGRISSETRDRILKIAEELNYQPNMMAKGLVEQKTYLIGVVLPYLSSSFFTNIINGIEERCVEKGFDIILGNSSSKTRSEKNVIKRMVNRRVDGIICCPDPRYFEFYQELRATNIPLIQIMTHVKDTEARSLLVDDEMGGYMATLHLLDLGHERIGFLDYRESFYEEIQLRKQGYQRALIEKGVPLDLKRFNEPSDLSIDGAYIAMKRLLNRNPSLTAVFAATDRAAIGAVQACLESGRNVPDDISVIGYDDIEIAEHQIRYPLTTIAQPKEKIGELSFDMLRRLIADEKVESQVLKPELVIRKTTKLLGPQRV